MKAVVHRFSRAHESRGVDLIQYYEHLRIIVVVVLDFAMWCNMCTMKLHTLNDSEVLISIEAHSSLLFSSGIFFNWYNGEGDFCDVLWYTVFRSSHKVELSVT